MLLVIPSAYFLMYHLEVHATFLFTEFENINPSKCYRNWLKWSIVYFKDDTIGWKKKSSSKFNKSQTRKLAKKKNMYICELKLLLLTKEGNYLHPVILLWTLVNIAIISYTILEEQKRNI